MKAVAALVLLGLAATAGARELLQAAPTDADILNFALNLEYLEAEFYSCAAFGTPLTSDLRGGGPASTGCKKATLDTNTQQYAEEIANNEIAHVTFLRSALGSSAVPMPLINIGTAFSAAADAAVGETLSPPFDPYFNSLFFYHGAFIFEDVGVTAYRGAAPLIENSTYLSAAAGILAVEAYHAGIVRLALYEQRAVVTPYNVTVADIVDAIAALRDSVDGMQMDDGGIISPSGTANLVPVNMNALAYARTPEEVLSIVYLGGTKMGGFFPNGINGYFGPNGAGASSSAGK